MVWYSVRIKRGQKLVTCLRTLSQSAPWDLLSMKPHVRVRVRVPASPFLPHQPDLTGLTGLAGTGAGWPSPSSHASSASWS